jgi:hypothetical protein
VVHEGDSQRAAFDAARRYRLLDVRNETGRRFRSASQLPSKYIQERPRLRCIRIVKTPSVNVLWESWVAHGALGCLCQVHIKKRQPILERLHSKTAKNKRDAEGSKSSLRKVIGVVLNVRIDRHSDPGNDARH